MTSYRIPVWLLPLITFLLGFFAYANTFNVFFLADDFAFLHGPSRMGLGQYISYTLQGGFLRPLVSLVFWIDYRLWGVNPAGYHFTNVLFHSLNGLWIYLITLLLLDSLTIFESSRRRGIALLAALIFLFLPSHPEAVVWLSGRGDVLVTFFYLAALGAYLRFRQEVDSSGGWIVLSLTSFALALIAKEPAITLPVVVGLNEVRLGLGGRKLLAHSVLFSRIGLLSIYFAVIPIYFGTRFVLLGTFTGGYGAVHMDYSLPNLQKNAISHLFLSVLPQLPADMYNRLIAMQGRIESQFGTSILTALLVILAAMGVGLLWHAIKHYPDSERRQILLIILFIGATYGVTLAPVINLGTTYATGEGSRYVYLPSVFTTILTALLIGILWSRWRNFLLVSGVLLAIYGSSLAMVNSKWRIAGTISRTLLDSAISVAQADHLYITNLPDTYQGIFIYRNGFRIALDLFGIRHYSQPTHILTYHNMTTSRDGLSVTPTDMPGVLTAQLENPSTHFIGGLHFIHTNVPQDDTFYELDALTSQRFTLFFHRFQPTDAVMTFSDGRVITANVIPAAIQLDQLQPYHDQSVGEIYGDHAVTQSFVVSNDGLFAFDLLLATFDRANTGSLNIVLADSNGAPIATWELAASTVVNNTWKRFAFSPLDDSGDQKYQLNIRDPYGAPGNAVTLWMYAFDGTYPSGTLTIAGNPVPGALTFRTYVTGSSSKN